jgi:hypothetical protein
VTGGANVEARERSAAMTDKQRQKPKLGRREFLRTIGVGASAAVAAAAPVAGVARADTESADEKRKARYQPDSPEVQTFYRVNRYPAK